MGRGTPLFLVGGMQGASMVMQDDGAAPLVNRITWTPMDGGKVRQHWETSFDGLYSPRAAR